MRLATNQTLPEIGTAGAGVGRGGVREVVPLIFVLVRWYLPFCAQFSSWHQSPHVTQLLDEPGL